MKTHNLKIERKYFTSVVSGDKRFELRKNDRSFMVGDIVNLEEVILGHKTGQVVEGLEIKYILHDGCYEYGLEEGYCIFNW